MKLFKTRTRKNTAKFITKSYHFIRALTKLVETVKEILEIIYEMM